MKQFAIALLATTMISSLAFAADSMSPQASQDHSKDQMQGQMQDQTQMQGHQQAPKPEAQNAANHNQQAEDESQPIAVKTLSRKEIREVQQALNKNGVNAGPTDGRWGPKTEDGLKQFEQAKKIPANGQLDRQAVASLGLNPSDFSQAQAK
jgi:hypothetical protein